LRKPEACGSFQPLASGKQAAGGNQIGSGGLWPPAPGSEWLHRFADSAFLYWPKQKAIKK
jgi:hypothetical protein